MPKFRFWQSCAVLAAASTVCAADLQWQATTLNLTTAPYQRTVDAVFAFKNGGQKPVTIVDLETNCDCLDAAADRKIYPPGASGTVKARFTVGDRLGLYERTIRVVTDEPGEPARLMVRIEVPELVTISPRSVTWPLNGPADEKVIELRAAPSLQIVFSTAEPTSSEFTCRLESVEPGRLYRLHLKVRDTAQPANTAVRLYGRDKSGETVLVSAYAAVH